MEVYSSKADMSTEREQNLLSYMPSYYIENHIMRDIQNSISVELDELDQCISDTQKQLFVQDATWGLKLWETELGITVDSEKTEGTRKNSILAKIRGLGVTTPKTLKDISELFSGSEVQIVELSDKYEFIIKFVSVRGIPSNQSDLSEAIEEIKPAHLTYKYEYTYLIWSEAATYLWDEARAFTWNQFGVQKPRAGVDGFITWGIALFSEGIRFWNSLKNVTWENVKTLKILD